jgi:hypothetical protein
MTLAKPNSFSVHGAAQSLRPSPLSIANGTRPGPRREDPRPDPEWALRNAQLDVYVKHQAVGLKHTFDYDPCRSK